MRQREREGGVSRRETFTFSLECLSHSTGSGCDHGSSGGAVTHTRGQKQCGELMGTHIEILAVPSFEQLISTV